MEFELRLLLAPGARRALGQHPLFQTKPPAQREVTAYWDTGDGALARAGLSLRVRRIGDAFRQTVKSAGSGRDDPFSAFSRGEWEWPLPSDRPDLSLAVRDLPPGAFPLPSDADVAVAFVTEIERASWQVDLRHGSTARLALDYGRIVAGDAAMRIDELEIEHESGPVEPLYRLALELHGLAPLRLSTESKADRGLRLTSGAPPEVRKPGKIHVDAEVGLADGLRQIFGACLAHLLKSAPAAALGAPEGVHQVRVALRRLRSALALFKPVLEPYAVSRFTDECRKMGRLLGQARDLDVFLGDTLLQAEADGIAVRRIRDEAERQRELAYHRVRSTLEGVGFTGFVLALAAWTAGDGWIRPSRRAESAVGAPLAEIAPRLLGRMARKVLKRTHAEHHPNRFDHLSDEELHATRKALKRLRYGVEFLGPLYDRKPVKQYRQACEALQSALGAVNDLRSTIEVASRVAGGDSVDLVPDAGALAGWCEARFASARHEVHACWKEFRRAEPFWAC